MMFGAGYSNMEGLILSGSVAQDNIFGTGKFVNLVNTGRVNKTYSLSLYRPLFYQGRNHCRLRYLQAGT